MAPYATLSHVNVLAAKRTFTATSIPSASQVAVYLEHAQAEIDGILGGDGYAVPVATTATISLKLLEHLTALGAWAFVERAAQVSADVKEVNERWDHAREGLARGTIQLVDAARLGGENFARAAAAGSAFFTRDMQL